MNRISFKTTLSVLFLFTLVYSCKPKTGKELIQPTAATYSQAVGSLVKQKCIGCHSGPTPAAKISFESFEVLKKYTESGSIIQRINDRNDPMPPKGIMSESNRALFQQWADEGFKK